jgi:hypothetical protein
VAQLHPRALGYLYVVSYDSQGYDGGILTLPQPGEPGPRIYVYILQEQDGPVQKWKSRYDRRPVNQYVLVPSPFGVKGVSSERISIRQ